MFQMKIARVFFCVAFSDIQYTAYVDPQFFYETVAPLLSVGTTTLIGISTLTSEINFYSEFLSF
jgi:hypothetical protein